MYISGGLYHLRRLCQSLHINALLCNRCRPLPFLWGVVDCVRLPFSLAGDDIAPRVPIGGIYIAVFIRRPQNLHRPAPSSITRRKIKRRLQIKRRKRRESKIRLRLFCFAYILHVIHRPQYNGAFTQCPIDTKAELYNAVLSLKNH